MRDLVMLDGQRADEPDPASWAAARYHDSQAASCLSLTPTFQFRPFNK